VFSPLTGENRRLWSGDTALMVLTTERAESGPVAADAAIAVAVDTVRLCFAAGRMAGGVIEPIVRPVLRTQTWLPWLRELAEAGFEQRQRARAELIRWYRRAAPAVVTDVLGRLDWTGILREVVDEMDLPEIIRMSAGSVAGATVRDVRIRTMVADDMVSKWVGRVVGRGQAFAEPVADAPQAAQVGG